MSQITLRQIPITLEKQIRLLAKQKNTSLNQVVLDMLKKYFGFTDQQSKKRDLSSFAGTWTSKDVKAFRKATTLFSKIDKKIWETNYEDLS